VIRLVGSGADRWGPVPVLMQDLRGHVHDHANLAGRRYPRRFCLRSLCDWVVWSGKKGSGVCNEGEHGCSRVE